MKKISLKKWFCTQHCPFCRCMIKTAEEAVIVTSKEGEDYKALAHAECVEELEADSA